MRVGWSEEGSLLLRLIWPFREELVRERIGVFLEAGLQRGKPLIHIALDRLRVADAGTDERQDEDEQRRGEDPAHDSIGHLFPPFGRSQQYQPPGIRIDSATTSRHCWWHLIR
jgi:hypothetical protein